ncbi:hypothetical protein [Kitasatospora aureofaciens]|uniref:hypothetical protein n=1 Tax=Kitasatospora aureofaciens TaxID=1894 RepID=UPI001DEE7D16|nr:hypothetical protein [Kitasatospora aureofaciens]HJD81115.1 hypothetical protein [Kitasatospora aureofaciens]
MRVLFIASPGIGHARPMRPMLRVFGEAGHEVAAAVSDRLPATLFDPSVPLFAKRPDRFPTNPLPRGPERVAWWREHNLAMARESLADSLDVIRSYTARTS